MILTENSRLLPKHSVQYHHFLIARMRKGVFILKCPNCGNHEFERIDYAIVRCTNCYSLFDPFIYPGFSQPFVDVGDVWDTNEDDTDDWDADE